MQRPERGILIENHGQGIRLGSIGWSFKSLPGRLAHVGSKPSKLALALGASIGHEHTWPHSHHLRFGSLVQIVAARIIPSANADRHDQSIDQSLGFCAQSLPLLFRIRQIDVDTLGALCDPSKTPGPSSVGLCLKKTHGENQKTGHRHERHGQDASQGRSLGVGAG